MKENQLIQFVSDFLEKAPPVSIASLGICSFLSSKSNLWDTNLKKEFGQDLIVYFIKVN